MAELDHGLKEIADSAGRQLARVAGLECSSWRPLESTLPATTELLADRVFLARQRHERFAVYFEFYARWHRQAAWDMLAKSGLLSKRVHLPTVCIAIVFQRRGYRPLNGTFRLEAAGGPTQQLWLREVCLWQTRPEAWWEEQPGLMALYPLCQHGKQPREAVQYAAETIERQVTIPAPRGEALALLTIFAEWAFPRLDVERLIGSEKMRESRMLRRVRREGELQRQRADILEVVEARFGPQAATELSPAINGLEDLDQATRLFRLALRSQSLEEVRSALAGVEQQT